MKNTNLKYYLFVLMSFLLIPLNAQEDPLSDINYGISTVNEVKKNYLQSKLFSEPLHDSSYFKYYINYQDLKLPVVASFNPDWYETDEIRQLKLNLNEDDTVYNPKGEQFIQRGIVGKEISEIDEILSIYKKWYGEPDSIFVPKLSDGEIMGRKILGKSMENEDRYYLWNEENFNISFHTPSPTYKTTNRTTKVYENAEILYSSTDYLEDFNRRKAKKRLELIVSDVVSVRITNPRWEINQEKPNNNNEIWDFKIDINDILREAKEEDRNISALRFDIVFKDVFNEEVSRLKNVTHELKEALEPFRGALYSNPIVYVYTYNMHSEYAIPVEKARRYSQNHSIIIFADVQKVLFSNGEIME